MPDAVLPPERLTARHDLAGFSNGKHPSLDEWLKERALVSEGLSARVYVIYPASGPPCVAGYSRVVARTGRIVELGGCLASTCDSMDRFLVAIPDVPDVRRRER